MIGLKKSRNIANKVLFKESILIPEVAREIIEIYLSNLELEKIDLTTLQHIPETFLEKKIQEYTVDILFSCYTKEQNKKMFIYFVYENQNIPNYWINMKVLKAVISIAERFAQKNPWSQQVPLIYPIVLYNAKIPHYIPCNFYKLFEDFELSQSIAPNYFILKDIKDISDEVLQTKVWGGTLLFFMKYVTQGHTAISIIKRIKDSMRQIYITKHGEQFLYSLLNYSKVDMLAEEAYKKLTNLLCDITNQETTKKLISLLSSTWVKEGENKGIKESFKTGFQKGKIEEKLEVYRELVSNMFKQGIPIEKISQITGLSISEIEAIVSLERILEKL